MLKVRVIPTLLVNELGLVKGVAFDSWRRVGTVLPSIKVYNKRDVDELILLDIVSNKFFPEPDYQLIEDVSGDCFVPFTVGGGVKKIEQVQRLLQSGADKISINTEAYSNPKLINEIARKHGAQCIVASVDVRFVGGKCLCFSHSGLENTGCEVTEWAKKLESFGAGEILLTSIDRDGTMLGYDLPLVETVVNAVGIPVIASGGAGNYEHMVDAVLKSGASAVAAASIFHFTESTPAGAKLALESFGVPVRKAF